MLGTGKLGRNFCFFNDMELLNDFGRVPDPLDGDSIGQHRAPQPGAQNAKAAWSMPWLAVELDPLKSEAAVPRRFPPS